MRCIHTVMPPAPPTTSRTHPSSPVETCTRSTTPHPSLPSPWEPPRYFLWPLWVSLTNGTVQYLVFCACLGLLSIMSSKLTHVVACVRISVLLKAGWHSTICTPTLCLSVQQKDIWAVAGIFFKEKPWYSLKVFKFYNVQHRVTLVKGQLLSAPTARSPGPPHHLASEGSVTPEHAARKDEEGTTSPREILVKPRLIGSVSEMSV